MTDWQALKLRINLWLMKWRLRLPGWLQLRNATESTDFGAFDDPERGSGTVDPTAITSIVECDLARIETEFARLCAMAAKTSGDDFDELPWCQQLTLTVDKAEDAAIASDTSEKPCPSSSEVEGFEQLAARRARPRSTDGAAEKGKRG